MDTTKELTVVEWFTGYGGNELGLKRVIPTMRPIAFCERDAFVVANLVSKMEKGLMDAVPVWTDATTFPVEPFKDRVGLFIASYPCQPFSHAGKRDGQNDERHLWPSCRRFVQGARPRLVFFENVEGHVSLGLSTVLADLEEDGYTAAWGIFSASEVGAPHQRKRVVILAYDRELHNPGADKDGNNANGIQELSRDSSLWHEIVRRGEGDGGAVWPSRPGEKQYAWEPPRVVGNSANERLCPQLQDKRQDSAEGLSGSEADNGTGEVLPVSQTQPPMGGNADGPADGLDFPGCTGLSDSELEEIYGWMVKGTNRTDELRMCGNGVVPQTAERAFRVLSADLGLTGADDTILTIEK